MLLRLVEEKWPIDEVVFYDTGMEFQAIYNIRDKVKKLLDQHGIKFTQLEADPPFEYMMYEKPIYGNKNGFHLGFSWCGGPCRWGTGLKLETVEKYCSGAYEYVGIAADEESRLKKERNGRKIFPLAQWGMVESDCLAYCRERGFDWIEDGGAGEVDLYDLLDRVSCWCCCNKNLKELRNIYFRMPKYWQKLKDMQSRLCRPMKGPGKSVFDLEVRFELEKEWLTAGKSIRSRAFFAELNILKHG